MSESEYPAYACLDTSNPHPSIPLTMVFLPMQKQFYRRGECVLQEFSWWVGTDTSRVTGVSVYLTIKSTAVNDSSYYRYTGVVVIL